jgi:acylphosphatase
VRNLPDRRVEIVAQGNPEQVQGLIAWTRSGPPMARVDEVEVAWEEPKAGEALFHVR